MKLSTIKRLCEAYKAAGRLAFVYPRLKRVSLNGGRSIPFEEAAKKIRECLDKR